MLVLKSPAMKKATMRILELSADEKARQLYEARLKERRDNYAREKGAILKIAKNFLDMGMSVADVAAGTGLSHDELEALCNSL